MGDSDEDDYMSEKFLQNDAKPGLMPKIFLEKHKRVEESRKRGREKKTKSLKVQEIEKREEKLNQALDESNKGFALLSKMGFKKGMGLGKNEQGRAEPIGIDLRAGRKGLGTEEEEKRKKQKLNMVHMARAKQRKIAEENLKGDFKNRIRKQVNERQASTDLFKSQKACEQLDSSKGFEKPYPWAWPVIVISNDEDENEICDDEGYEEEDVFSQLDMLTEYLRSKHLYCIWCGTAFDDEDDLTDNCPGRTYEDHDS